MLDNLIYSLLDNVNFGKRSADKYKIVEKISDYVTSQYHRFKFVKTSLFRDEPVDFYKNYIPLTLNNKALGVNSNEPLWLLEKYKRLIVIGGAGSGKTTLLRHMILECISYNKGIPVSVDLRTFGSKEGGFEDYVAGLINEEFIDEVKAAFNNGGFIFFMDGFDEIRYDKDESFIAQIQNFALRYSNNKFIISSRPGTNVESLNGFYVMYISSLSESDIYLYLNNLTISSLVKSKIMAVMAHDGHLKDMLTNPLLISLYAMALSVTNAEFSNKKSVYFRVVLDSLLSKHDAVSKLGYVREKLSGLNKDELESVSTIIAFRAFSASKYQFSKDDLYKEFQIVKRLKGFNFDNDKLLYDLLITVNILSEEGVFYSFPHVMLIEYLAALFIARLDEYKIKIYQNLLTNNRLVISVSFLEFANELDQPYFVRYYLIPVLEKINEIFYLSHNEQFEPVKDFVLVHYLEKHDSFSPYSVRELLSSLRSEYEGEINDDFDMLFNL